ELRMRLYGGVNLRSSSRPRVERPRLLTASWLDGGPHASDEPFRALGGHDCRCGGVGLCCGSSRRRGVCACKAIGRSPASAGAGSDPSLTYGLQTVLDFDGAHVQNFNMYQGSDGSLRRELVEADGS